MGLKRTEMDSGQSPGTGSVGRAWRQRGLLLPGSHSNGQALVQHSEHGGTLALTGLQFTVRNRQKQEVQEGTKPTERRKTRDRREKEGGLPVTQVKRRDESGAWVPRTRHQEWHQDRFSITFPHKWGGRQYFS